MPERTEIGSSELLFRPASREDVSTIVAMLADDPLGTARELFEDPLPQPYYDAFVAISSDPNNELVVATLAGEIVGFLQLTLIPGLTYKGGWRALVEGVRVSKTHRSRRIGHHLLRWAIARAGEKGCYLVQLTTDKSRGEALQFYQSLGFTATHHGLKLKLK
jgi:ribosomal protein S18 acetylase RimI-like enzyme